jgi:hypothetical protein
MKGSSHMKFKFTLLLILLFFSLLPTSMASVNLNDNHNPITMPVFISLNDTGTPTNSYIYDNQTVITINYKADRYNIDGLILLGQGSNLTENKDNLSQNRNFTKDYSLRDQSYYSIEINVTSYTYFYAYAWYGSYENGTYEEVSLVGGQSVHQLYINEGKWYPQILTNEEIYVPYNNNFTIQYKVKNFENETDDYVTLSVSENSSAIYEQSKSIVYSNMTKVNYTEIDGDWYSIFEFELNVTLPLMYFSAFNENGWERSDGTSALYHEIGTGFNFTTSFNEGLSLYTDVDTVKFNITTFNITDDFTDVGYKIRTHQNISVYNDTTSWTEVNGLNVLDEVLLNTTVDGNTNVNSSLRSIYNVTLTTYEVDNIIEIQSFLKYGVDSNLTSEIYSITIIDASPIIIIENKNETITRADNAIVFFEMNTPKGEIVEAQINHILPNEILLRTYDVLEKENTTFNFAFDDNQTILQGVHIFEFNVTNSLNVSEIYIHTIVVDQEGPSGSIEAIVSANGKVEIEITYVDIGIAPTGIDVVKINWGNNMTVNATGLSSLNFQYTKNGVYNIVLIIYDLAGNFIEISTEVQINNISENNLSSETVSSPINQLFMVLGFFILTSFRYITNKKEI